MTFKRSLTSTFMIGMLLLGSSGMIAPEAPRQNTPIAAPTAGACSFVSIPAVLAEPLPVASANSDETGWSEYPRSDPDPEPHATGTSGDFTGDAWETVYETYPAELYCFDFDNDDVADVGYWVKVYVYKLKETQSQVDKDYYIVEVRSRSEVYWTDNGCHKSYYSDWLHYLKDVGPYTHEKWVEIKLEGQDNTSREVELSHYQPHGTIDHIADTYSLGAGFAAEIKGVSVGFNTNFSRSIGHDRLEITPHSVSPEHRVSWREEFDGPDYSWWPSEKQDTPWTGKIIFPPRVACHSYPSSLFLEATVTNARNPSSPPDSLMIKVTPKAMFYRDDNLTIKGGNTVGDREGCLLGGDSFRISVPANQFTPTAKITGQYYSEVPEDEPRSFSAKGGDYDGTPVTFVWELKVGGHVETGYGDSFSYRPGYDVCTLGKTTRIAKLTLKATDGERESESDEWSFNVTNVNRRPEIKSVHPRAEEITVWKGGYQPFYVNASDPDREALTYTWMLNGKVQGYKQNWTYGPAKGEPGTIHIVEVTVSDGDKQQIGPPPLWRVEIGDNRKPRIEEFLPRDTTPSVNEGGSLTFSLTASDPDPYDTLSYTWKLDGVQVSTGNSSYTYRPGYEDAGIHQLEAVVSDGHDAVIALWDVTVRNVNRSPSINSYKPTEWNPTIPEVDEGNSLDFEVEASDPDQDNTLSYTWKLDGKQASTGSEYYTYEPDYDAAGAHSVEVIVSDGLAEVTWLWVGVTVNNVNRAPLVRLIEPDGGESWSGFHDIRWDASDPDGDAVTIDIVYSPDGGQNWRVISRGVPNTGILTFNTAYYCSDGAYYRIKIVASDGDLTGEDISQYCFTVDNSPPTWTQTTGLQAAVVISSASGVDVMLSWNAAEDLTPKVKYNVYYDTVAPLDFNEHEKIPNVPVQSARSHDYQYTVTGLSAGQTYYFAVRAEDSADFPNEDRNQVTLSVYSTLGASELDMNDLVMESMGVVTGPDLGAYTFNGSVTVLADDTLTVNPGATLVFADTSGGCCLNVYGTLVADDVAFTSSNQNRGDWYGIILEEGSHASIDMSTVEYARTGISCYYCDLTVTSSTIQQNSEDGIYFVAPAYPLTIDHNAIQDNGRYGILGFGSSGGSISGNTIQSNGADGIFNDHGGNWAVYTKSVIGSNMIQLNSLNGIFCSRCDWTVEIRGNIIMSNAEAGIIMIEEGPAGLGPLILSNHAIAGNRYGIWSENVAPTVRDNMIIGNTMHGVVCMGHLMPDIGTHDLNTHPNEPDGYNEIWRNAGYDIYNPSEYTVNAQNNWWGQSVPAQSQFHGNVLYSHYLPTPPISPMPTDFIPPLAPTGLVATAGHARVDLSWNANTDLDSPGGGYRVHYGTVSGYYDNVVNVGNVTSYSLGGLWGLKTYFIAISAYDSAGNRSDYSEEVSASP